MIKLILSLLFLIQLSAVVKENAYISNKPKKHFSKDYKHIEQYILNVTKDKKHAKYLANKIVYYSNKYKLDPEVVTAVAKVESDFKMSSKPCVGIMQIYLPTYREMEKGTRLSPYKAEDNIHLGVRELARYYYKPSRSKPYQRLKYALGRYNGSGSNSRYTSKVINVVHLIRKLKNKKQ